MAAKKKGAKKRGAQKKSGRRKNMEERLLAQGKSSNKRTKLANPLEVRLMAIAISQMSGSEVLAEYESETGRKLSPGTLFTTFRRLKDYGWVDVCDEHDRDGRIRLFQITNVGRRALRDAQLYYHEVSLCGATG